MENCEKDILELELENLQMEFDEYKEDTTEYIKELENNVSTLEEELLENEKNELNLVENLNELKNESKNIQNKLMTQLKMEKEDKLELFNKFKKLKKNFVNIEIENDNLVSKKRINEENNKNLYEENIKLKEEFTMLKIESDGNNEKFKNTIGRLEIFINDNDYEIKLLKKKRNLKKRIGISKNMILYNINPKIKIQKKKGSIFANILILKTKIKRWKSSYYKDSRQFAENRKSVYSKKKKNTFKLNRIPFKETDCNNYYY